MKPVLAAGLCYGALNYGLLFPALGMTSASAAALTIELYVPFSIILSVIFLGERIGIYRIMGICCAFIGVAIIALSKPDEAAGPLFLLGIFLIMGAAMADAIGAVLVKSIQNVKPLELLAWFAVVGTCVLWPISWMIEDEQLSAFDSQNLWPFLAALTYSIFAVSIISHASYYWLLQRLPIYIVSSSGLLTTLIAVCASILILGEPLTPPLIFGGLMTLSGVAMILWRNSHHPKQVKPAQKT